MPASALQADLADSCHLTELADLMLGLLGRCQLLAEGCLRLGNCVCLSSESLHLIHW